MIRSARTHFIPALFLGFSVFATTSVMAQSALRVDCNARVNDLGSELTHLNNPVFGIRARDWNAETVSQWQRQALACVNGKANWSEETMKAPMRQKINAMAANPAELFAERDRALSKEGRISAVASQNLSLVTMANGTPQEIRIDDEPRTCTSISKGIGLTSEENYRQAIAFARLCQQVGYTKADTVSALEAAASRVAPVRKILDDFANRVDTQARQPQVSPDAIQALRKQRDALYAQFQVTGLMTHPAYPPNSKKLQQAESQLNELSQQAQLMVCKSNVGRAGFPAAWKEYYVLMEWNSPDLFCAVVTGALDSGAKVSYLPSGMFRKEGFEVKSAQRTVQIFLKTDQVPGGDPSVKMMIPVSAKIDGKSTDVTRNNLRAVAAELIAAMRNQ